MAKKEEITLRMGLDNGSVIAGIERVKKELRGVGTVADKATANIGKSFFSAMSPLVAFGASIFSIATTMNFLSESIQKMGEQERSMMKVEQAVKNTGASAGYTAQQLFQMASELQAVTTFGDEEILNKVTAQLLTFTNITGSSFERAQEAILDLATVLDGDLQSASIMVGKALNDPIAGMTAMQRAGVQFSDSQKDVIKSLVATGDVATAQLVILDELNAQYGGQAEAAAKTYVGQIAQLSNAFGDLQENIGAGLMPILQPLAGAMLSITNILYSISPTLLSVITGVTALGIALAVLKSTGIGGAILSLMTWKVSLLATMSAQAGATATTLTSAQALMVYAATTPASIGGTTALAAASGLLTAGMAGSTTAIGVASAAVKAFFVSLGPIGWATIAIGALVGAFALLSSTKEELDPATQQIIASSEVEIAQYESLTDVLLDTNAASEDRQKALDILQDTYPGYFDNLSIEASQYASLTAAVARYKNELIAATKAKIQLQRLENIQTQITELESEGPSATDRFQFTDLLSLNIATAWIPAVLEPFKDRQGDAEESWKKGIEELEKQRDKLADEISQQQIKDSKEKPVTPSTTSTPGGGTRRRTSPREGTVDEYKTQKAQRDMKISLMSDGIEKERALLLASASDREKRIQETFTDEKERNAMILQSQTKFLLEASELQSKYDEAEANIQKERAERLTDGEKKIRDMRISLMSDGIEKERALLIAKYHDEQSTIEENYEEKIRKAREQQPNIVLFAAEEYRLTAMKNEQLSLLAKSHYQTQAEIQKKYADEREAKLEADAEREIAIEREKWEKIVDFSTTATSKIQEAMQDLFTLTADNTREELRDRLSAEQKKLDKAEEVALSTAKTEAERDKIREKYEQKRLESEQKAEAEYRERTATMFALQKASAIASATVNIATAVTKAWAEGGAILGPILAGIVAAAGAVQIAVIASQELPGFRKGGYTGDGNPDEIAGVVHRGEYVIPAEMLRQNRSGMMMIPAISGIEKLEKKLTYYLENPVPPRIIVDSSTSAKIANAGNGRTMRLRR